jgi:hypothetical protein
MAPANRFWNTMYEMIFHGYLLELHCQKSAQVNSWMQGGLAVTSTTSLGIWAVFKAYPGLWACIIVGTQIITAISKYFPYATRLKASAGCSHDFREIQNWAEARWCEILDGALTDSQINKARVELQTRTAKSLKLHFPLGGLPSNKSFEETATAQTEKYLATQYGG